MNVKVVIVKSGSRGRPPICPWVIEAAESSVVRAPTK
jgi:hypothetical protein